MWHPLFFIFLTIKQKEFKLYFNILDPKSHNLYQNFKDQVNVSYLTKEIIKIFENLFYS